MLREELVVIEQLRTVWIGLAMVAAMSLSMGGCYFSPPGDSDPNTDPDLPARVVLTVMIDGPEGSVSAGEVVTLTASISESTTGTLFSWVQNAGLGVVISGADTSAAQFTAPSFAEDTSLSFVVTVSADGDAVGQATVTVMVLADPNFGIDPNDPTNPEADAGDDLSEAERVEMSLTAAASTGLGITYGWEQTGGEQVSIDDPNQSEIRFETPEFVSGGENTLQFQLTVTDNQGRKDRDEIVVTVTEVELPRVEITTSLGAIVVELEEELAPLHTANFLMYVDNDFYPGTIFHRVVNGPDIFVVQGGGFDEDLEQKDPNDPVDLEADNGLLNVEGSLGAARTSDPNSATSQFYFNGMDNPGFDPENNPPGFTVFGRVIRGLNIVQDILVVPTGDEGGLSNVPETPVTIDAVERVDK